MLITKHDWHIMAHIEEENKFRSSYAATKNEISVFNYIFKTIFSIFSILVEVRGKSGIKGGN